MVKPVIVLCILVFFSTQQVDSFAEFDFAQAYQEQKDGLLVTAQLFTHKDCVEYFGVDLIKKGVHPVQISIINRSKNPFSLYPSYISLPIISEQELASVLGLSMWPFIFATAPLLIFYYWRELRYIAALILFAMWRHNKWQKKQLKDKVFYPDKEGITINPHSAMTSIIFIPENEFFSCIVIGFFNNHTQQFTKFDVDLLQRIRWQDRHFYVAGTALE